MLRKIGEVDQSKLIGEQTELFKDLIDFVENDDRQMFCIEAEGGSGKTFTTSMFAEYLLFNKDFIVGMGALTHKAVFVQTKQAEYESDNLEYRTIQSILGVKPQINEHGKEIFYRTFKDAENTAVGDYDIIFIDEVSQKDSVLMGYLEEDLQKFPSVKVVFMGDLFQLGPAGEGSCSIPLNPIMRKNKKIRYFRLTQVIRQKDDNPVLKHCRMLRDDIIKVAKDNSDKAEPVYLRAKKNYELNKDNKNLEKIYGESRKTYLNSVIYTLGRDVPTGDYYKPFTELNDKGEGVVVVRKEDQNKVLKTLFGEEFEKNPDFVRMTSWTNVEVNKHNSLIRKMIYRGKISKYIEENKADMKNLKKNIAEKFPYYEISTNKLNLPKYLTGDQIIVDKPVFNSNSEIIFNTSEELEITDIIDNAVMVMNDRYKSYQAVVENIWTGKKNVIEICHEDSEALLEKNLDKMADLAKKEEIGTRSRRTRWVDYYNLRKHFAQLKYLPSMTTYKAQGSTYNNIIINYPDIIRNPKRIQRLQHLYVAMSRASNTVYIFE